MSFKVICVDATDGSWGIASLLLKEGAIYTVIGFAEETGGYILSEVRHPNEPSSAWKRKRFIPLSEIDETEYSTIEEKEPKELLKLI